MVEGLKLFVPPGTAAVVRERMSHLNRGAAKLELYELNGPEESLEAVDTADRGNISTRLVRSPDEVAARERFAASITRIASLLPEAEAVVLSPSAMAFRLRGLEFAQARLEAERGSFRSAEQVVFGVGAHETVLDEGNAPFFENLVGALAQARRADGRRDDPLWRMRPQRWLESLVVGDVSALDSRLDPAAVYSQVPAFSASDRAIIDVLAATRDGRLAVLELKAELAPEIEWTLLGVDERWHEGVRVVFRKKRTFTAD